MRARPTTRPGVAVAITEGRAGLARGFPDLLRTRDRLACAESQLLSGQAVVRNRHFDSVDDTLDLSVTENFCLSLKLFDLFFDLRVRLRHGYFH
jgi:hypothetical protein